MNITKPPARILLPALLVTAAAIAFLVVSGGHAPGIGPGRQPSAADARMEALLQAQRAQDARLDRMETMLGGIASAAGIRLPAAGAGMAREVPHHEQTPQEQQAQLDKSRAAAEAGFNAEPVTRAWASRTEKTITDAFATQNLAFKDAPVPRLHQSSCRSRTCRIELVYGDEAEAEVGMLFLLSDIGGVLGQSRPFQRVLPDGSVQLVLYATAGAPPKQGPDRH